MTGIVKRDRYLNIIIHIAIIVFFLFFFIHQCPLVIFDTDDWIGLGNFRAPIPIWGGWNPSRVLPETLMPAAGWIAAHIVYPLCGDYVYSVTIISAVIITLLIAGMSICLQRLLVVRCRLAETSALACEIFFIILFFLIFRNRGTSACMFTAADLCCIYNYTIPGILNAIVVLILLRNEDITETFLSWNLIQKILFLLMIYFALFSHLFHSAITAIYAGIYLLLSIWFCKRNIKQILRKNSIMFLILAMWGTALVFEASGGRAGSLEGELDFVKALRQLAAMIRALSKPFILISVALFIVIVVHMWKKRFFNQTEFVSIFVNIICNEMFLVIFLLLLNTKTAYMSRIDASWGMWFYLITMMVVALAYVIREASAISQILPIMIPILVFAAVYPDGKFLMSTRENTDYQTCLQLDYYVINSIVEASEKEMAEIEIRIPDHSEDLRSLTYNENLGKVVADCLYTQGIIQNKPDVQTIVDKNMNDVFEKMVKIRRLTDGLEYENTSLTERSQH